MVAMRILVTGAAGFIGSCLVDRLLEGGHEVVGVDDLDPFYSPELKRFYLADALARPGFRLMEGDIREPETWERASGISFDAVVHLAALAGVRPSIQDPVRYQEVNVGGTQRALEFARRRGIRRFLFASSSSVYGDRGEAPFSEDDRVEEPISPYAATKRAGELLCHTYHHLFDLDVLCLRFFTVYGPRQRPDLAIHKFARLVARGEPIPRYGDGSSRRDYTYVDDVLQGVLGALDYLGRNEDVYEIVNLGESETVRLSRLIELIGEAMGTEPEVRALPEQPGDVRQTFADVSKARRLLGYEPTTPIGEGIERFVKWFRRNEERLVAIDAG